MNGKAELAYSIEACNIHIPWLRGHVRGHTLDGPRSQSHRHGNKKDCFIIHRFKNDKYTAENDWMAFHQHSYPCSSLNTAQKANVNLSQEALFGLTHQKPYEGYKDSPTSFCIIHADRNDVLLDVNPGILKHNRNSSYFITYLECKVCKFAMLYLNLGNYIAVKRDHSIEAPR